MFNRYISILVIASFAFTYGCKKEEEPKESESTTPQKVEEPKTAKKTGALKKATDKPKDRQLVRKSKAVKKADEKKGDGKKAAKTTEKKSPPKAKAKLGDAKPKTKATPKRSAASNKAAPNKPSLAIPSDKLKDKPKEKSARAAATPKPKVAAKGDSDAPEVKPATSRVRNAARNQRDAKETVAKVDPSDDWPRVRPSERRRSARKGPSASRASNSMSKRNRGSSQRARPNAELLLRRDDLLEILKYRKKVDVHQLSGTEPDDDEYDGIYWGSLDGKTFVASLQIWRHRSPIESQRRYSQMLRSYPNAEETDAITKKTFLAYWNNFIYLAFFDMGKHSVVNLTCHRTVCNTPQKLVQLAARIRERL